MTELMEIYKRIYSQLNEISIEYNQAEQRLLEGAKLDKASVEKRVEKLNAMLEQIADAKEKVEYYQAIAEQHITSRNLLTITPREVDFSRLRDWTMLIDLTSNDDPHAMRVYVLSQCNKMYLEEKQSKFEKELFMLTDDSVCPEDSIRAEVEEIHHRLETACVNVLQSPEFSRLAVLITEAHAQYSDTYKIISGNRSGKDNSGKIGVGVYAMPLPVIQAVRYIAKQKLDRYYGENTSSILLPVELDANRENIIAVNCHPSQDKHVYRGIQNYLLNQIVRSSPESRKICFFDALHYNSYALGLLRPLENTACLGAVPKDSEALMDSLKLFSSEMSDLDEQLGIYDSVDEYNAHAAADKKIRKTTLVLMGYPSSFPTEAIKIIDRVIMNREHYGISIIMANMKYSDKAGESSKGFENEISNGILRIAYNQQKARVSLNSGEYYSFSWYELKDELPKQFVEYIKSIKSADNGVGNVYTRHINIDEMPRYSRNNKEISLPYGIDCLHKGDDLVELSFNNENFASFIMGASGSGKSTLLHTLITDIIRNYHPDEVELWLADFKMSEFAQYIDPMPPHVKYILLDESQELVFDLIDKLTEKMMERQRFFMRNKELKKVEKVSKETYMPIIFVILDEFSIMSQAVSESEVYQLRLQNLLAKGRALGIKFIFASQTFTKGVNGLTKTAKEQIQSRIAMKNSFEEITETLALPSSSKTEQVKNWMNALPPHYSLYKYIENDTVNVKKVEVLFFEGEGADAYAPQRTLIGMINDNMHPVEESEYNPELIDAYVNKHPVVVDGNSYFAFKDELIFKSISDYRRGRDEISPEDVVINVGKPRKMTEYEFTTLTNESRQNILLLARAGEQVCAMSVILSTMKCFEYQGGKVQVWAYEKNRLYRAYKDTVFTGYTVTEGIDDICDAIKALKKRIDSKENGKELIVLVGMDQICIDFDYITGTSTGKVSASDEVIVTDLMQQISASGGVATDDAAIEEAQMDQECMWAWFDYQDKALSEGKTSEELDAEYASFVDDFYAQYEKNRSAAAQPAVPAEKAEAAPEKEVHGAYNASADFAYIIKHGSRLGYRFMLCLNNISDIKQCGLKLEFFKHRMGFQMSAEDSKDVFDNKVASALGDHVCEAYDTIERFSFRPYLHEHTTWDGWGVDKNGNAISPFI